MSALELAPSSFILVSKVPALLVATNSTSHSHFFSKAVSIAGPGPHSAAKES